MIKLTDITENLTNVFNQNPMGLTFKLFTDTGKYKRAIRRYNTVIDYINGIVSVTSSNVTKTNDGFIIGTMTNRIELLVRCKDDEEDEEDGCTAFAPITALSCAITLIGSAIFLKKKED